MLANQRAIVDCAALNEDGVLVTGADNGSLWCVQAWTKNPQTLKILFPFFANCCAFTLTWSAQDMQLFSWCHWIPPR